MSETVILPKNLEPKFPDRCLVCRQKENIGPVPVKGEAAGMSGYVKWIAGRSGRLMVPAHAGCAKKLRRRAFWRNIGVLVLFTALPIAWFAMRVNGIQMPFEFNKLTLCVAAVILFIPIVIAETLLPAAFEFREGERIVTFEFEDQDYAEEFARLNGTETGINEEFIEELGKDFTGIGRRID